jgi:predicted transcriptional regulator
MRPVPFVCRQDTLAGAIRAELRGYPGWGCPVVNAEGVVVGRVRPEDLPDDDDVAARTFMRLGPATVRPREGLRDLIQRMGRAEVEAIFVTSTRGHLLGIVHRSDGERLVAERGSKPA